MTEMQDPQQSTRYPDERFQETEPTAWVGWILFAGTMLLLVGFFQAIAGFVALFDKTYYAANSDLVVTVDYDAWGWVHIGLGLLAVAGGFGVMAGKTWARVYAVAYAGIAAVVNMSFMRAYPVWMTILIAIDVLVIYALCVHGREVKSMD